MSSTTGTETPSGQPNPEEAKRLITAARDSLSQITQMPAASQLTGETRTQMSQLISSFNELITTNTEWRASYDKVEANLNALLGSATSDEAPQAQASTGTAAGTTTGTAGAVGTSGTSAGLDPAIRAKLIEFRQHMSDFEKAAGGAQKEPSAASGGATSAYGAPSTASGTTGTSSSAALETAPRSMGTSGTSSGTMASTANAAAAGHTEAMRHVAAIEAILNGQSPDAATSGTSSTSGATGTSGSTASAVNTLDRAQIEQLRTHLNELKRLLAEGGR